MSDNSYQTDRDDADPGGEVHAAGGDCLGCSGGEAPAQITASLVPEKERIGFLPRVTEGRNLAFEFCVYDMARGFSPDYGGGFWNFYELSNGGFYIAPDDDAAKKFRVSVESNGYAGECSADALGIICSLYSLNMMLWRLPSEFLRTQYYALYDYAAQHPEATTIFGAID